MMTTAIIQSSKLQGEVVLPASKSHSQRGLLLALLHHGITRLYSVGHSEDEKSALSFIQQAGAKVSLQHDHLEIIGADRLVVPETIDCGESATLFRMAAPILASQGKPFTLTGKGTLLSRSVTETIQLLQYGGTVVAADQGRPPLRISGRWLPPSGTIDATTSSQHISGLLLAASACSPAPLRFQLTQPVSRHYIQMTIAAMARFGRKVVQSEAYTLEVWPATTSPTEEVRIQIEPDWSGASLLMAAAAVGGDLVFPGLSPLTLQADRAILDLLVQAGAKVDVGAEHIRVQASFSMKPFAIDITDTPDLFPAAVLLATGIEGVSEIRGLSRLRNKESHRVQVTVAALSAMGADLEVAGDLLRLNGGKPLNGQVLESHGDHRMAMLLSLVALQANQASRILDAQCVSKSFPGFYEQLTFLGASVHLSSHH